ncbi:bromodomain adjacent to zinc finger domain protein 1A-like isoform X1 [Ornithodoros turicata]|uniref:bromodomain adjacent to zinc finger domain protein 1A-like isoform X1 n=1 Tax=Ornithodoros turicata TaxID=34597 RepID=UPI003139F0D9
MPLYGKNPFIRKEPPADLKPDDEVFCCKVTAEVFDNYEEYFARVILCNSLVWTCSVTGKPGLTFQDAQHSEEQAISMLKQFPAGLRKPLLYLATLTRRGRLADLCDDVFSFARDRYFIGETVEVTIKSQKKTCTVTGVSAAQRSKSPSKATSPHKKPLQPLAADKVKYEVQDSNGKTHVASGSDVCRKKNSYTRDKNRIFFRQGIELADDVLVVKESTQKKYSLKQTHFTDIFAGPPPSFSVSPKGKGASAEKGKKSKASPSKETPKKKEAGTPKKDTAEKQAAAAAAAAKAAEELAKKRDKEMADLFNKKMAEKEERKIKVQQKLEEKKLYAQFMSEWNSPREDLECDDLKELPPLVPLKCSIPQEQFGDLVMVLEFLNLFPEQLDLKDYFASGVTFDLLEQAVKEVDVLGILSDVFQLLLTAILRTQEEEMQVDKRMAEGEESGSEDDAEEDEKFIVGGIPIKKAQKAATAIARRPQQVLGMKLTKVMLDALSLTEVLRLHLGGSGSLNIAKKVYSGWYTQREDPGLWFAAQEPEIMAKLATSSIYDLSAGEKIKLMRVLVEQLLSMETFRSVIEENWMRLKQLKHDVKQLRIAFFREDREAKLKKNKDGAPDAKKDAADGEDKKTENKDNTPESVELNKALLQKKEREDARRKEEFERKEQALRKEIDNLQRFCCLQPIGQDRMHRRYWAFSSLPGLFVEDNDTDKGACLPGGTPLVSCELPKNPSIAFMESFLLKRRGEECATDSAALSDKENKETAAERKPPNDTKSQKLLGDSNPRVARRMSLEAGVNGCVDPKRDLVIVLDKMESNTRENVPSGKAYPFGLCSGLPETCSVHGSSSGGTSWWFCGDKDQLEALIGALNQRGFRESKLRTVLKREAAHYEMLIAKCPKKKLNPDTSWPEEPEVVEEVRKSSRLNNNAAAKPSNLAGIESRLAQVLSFREALLDLEEKVFAGSLGMLKNAEREKWREKLDSLLLAVETKNKDTAEINKLSEELNYAGEVALLSGALVEVSLAIERKFLQPPLGETEEQRKKRKTAELARKSKDDEGEEPPKKTVNVMEVWRDAARKSTSVAQLFLYMSSLERSIAWDRSVLKAYCRICRRRRDPENMLLCDGCDRGHHLYCLRPPLDEIPKGDWYCTTCRPKEKPASPTKRKYIEEDELESEDGDEDMNEEEEEESEEAEDENDDTCNACKKGGTLICCDSCPLSFHMECTNPPLRRVPRGAWSCTKCTKAKSDNVTIRGKGSRTRSQSAAVDSKRYMERQQHALATRKRHSAGNPVIEALKGGKRFKRSSDAASSHSDDTVSSRGSSRRSSQDLPLDFKACDEILQAMVHDADSWPFHCAVSRRSAPDYYDIIKRPMDLGKIRGKLSSMEYRTTKEFVADVYLIFQNCSVYNSAGSPEYAAGSGLLGRFEKLLVEHGLRGFPHSDCFQQEKGTEKRSRRSATRK